MQPYSPFSDQVAKKPYNPIIGEVFQCSYYVSKSSESTDDGNDDSTAAPSTETHHRIKYVSEQVISVCLVHI